MDNDAKLIFEAYATQPGKLAPEQVAAEVKASHGWDIEQSGDGTWWRLDAPGGERPVTGDEHWDIMRIEDPEKAAEYARKQNPGY